MCEDGFNFCAVGAGACCPSGSTCGSDNGVAACVAIVSTTTSSTTTSSRTSTSSTETPTETDSDDNKDKDKEDENNKTDDENDNEKEDAEKDEQKVEKKDDDKPPKEKSSINAGVIIGIVFSILGAIGLAFVIYVLYSQKKNAKEEKIANYAHPPPPRAPSKASTVAAAGLGILKGLKKEKKPSVRDLEIGHPQMIEYPSDRNFSFQNGNSSSEQALTSGGLPPSRDQGRCITPPNASDSNLNNKALPLPPNPINTTPPVTAGKQKGQSSPSMYSPTHSFRRPSDNDNMTAAQRTYTAFSPQYAPKPLDNPLPHIATQYKPFSPGYNMNQATEPQSMYPSSVAPLKIDKPVSPPPRSSTSPGVTLAERRLRGSRGSGEFKIPAPIDTNAQNNTGITIQRQLSTPSISTIVSPTVHTASEKEVKQVSVTRQISDVQKERSSGPKSDDDENVKKDKSRDTVVSPLSPRAVVGRGELPDILKVRTPMTGTMASKVATPYW
ncbi:hypothetical protein BJ508DRAFT_415866 [Ascobolus immersus RN42]|uniref:Uncharacterized protein n=1 Tax=Ascobolus immersus RN42 TaxID=1160509 RepID=A0A3N4I2F3_ASCIM|nr:hypothetical protein BJ508DRAFT_415866 [Ascobolus immersus RN42]